MNDQTKVIPWAERMAKLGKAQAANEVVAGKFFSTKAGQLSYDGNAFPDNEGDFIVVAHCIEHDFFKDPYNPANIVSPDCFAFGKTLAMDNPTIKPIVPHDKSAKKQAKACDGCPRMEWKSDLQGGRGKACKEIRRLALIPADSVQHPDKILSAPVGYLRVPVMSVPNWAAYMQQLAAQSLAPLMVATKVSIRPDPKSQFKIHFAMIAPFKDQDTMAALWAKGEAAHASIDFPYTYDSAAPAADPNKKAKM